MPNRLAAEASPYLLQHADNPVEWWPWCEEALVLARERDLPVLLSIGYSACHWCHVMAHESFDDGEVAALMNRHFVNIKVDREERPDIDHIYQTAHQVLTGRPGGWPLTVFMTPDQVPFFAGTYFPKTPRYRLPGFMDLLRDIAQTFATQRAGIDSQNARLREELARVVAAPAASGGTSDVKVLEALRKALGKAYDRKHGGFGDAPKFPRPADLEFLLAYAHCEHDEGARDMALTTLLRMAEGGLYDHLGGGFFRYSTDERWRIPHFEKMLYDNGPLLRLYSDAWLLTKEPRFREVVVRTAEWTMREMQSPQGGFHAALDADSEGHEGRFYVWDRKTVRALLPEGALRLVERHWGLDGRANFEGEAWHLHVAEPFEKSAKKARLEPEAAEAVLDQARRALFAERDLRVRPGRDGKILTGWNALMIGGLARAARAFDRPDWLAAARAALDFVRRASWRDGRLLAVSDGGPGRLNAYLDDHAFLIEAVLELLQTDFDADELHFACALADALLEHFEDREGGGFYFTRHDHEALILRPKPLHDTATASGNGVAARALGRLGHLVGDARYVEAAERAVSAAQGALERSPMGCASLALALADSLASPAILVLTGPEAEAWQRALAGCFRPDMLTVTPRGQPGTLPEALLRRSEGRTQAWLCVGTRCEPPLDTLEALVERVRNSVFRG